LRIRPLRRLPPAEAAIERAIRALLGEGGEEDFDAACAAALSEPARDYCPFLPAPLWGEARLCADGAGPVFGDEDAASSAASNDERAHKARRCRQEQTERRDYLALNRFEKLLTQTESMNLARPVEDDEEDGARRATEDASEIVLSPHGRSAATRLRLELDLAPAAAAEGAAAEGLRYPEWDWRRRAYRADYCRVVAAPAPAGDVAWRPSPDALRRIRRVRRHFEALRPRRELMRAQIDGDEIDMEALVRARTDFAAGGTPSDRIYQTTRKQGRDLAAALLVDVSLSTEAWVGTQRVIDISREAALLFCHAMDACGDAHAVFSFTSRGRNEVRVNVVKEFSELLSPTVERRLGALKPGHYTRIGAALRHVTAQLASQPAQRRLLLALTDGKPNDCDHYEGRFGVEDARRAVQEARRGGAAVFGVTIDSRAQAHFPVLFGRGGFAIISDPSKLPAAMPLLLRHIIPE
jgi:nitric oxide reductase NorD protein